MNSVKYGPTEKRLKDSLNKEIKTPLKRPNKPNDKKPNIIFIVNKIKVSKLNNNENIFNLFVSV